LNFFKLQTKFKLDLLPEFLIQFLLGIYLPSNKVWRFLDIWKVMICNFIGGAYEAIWKISDYWKSLLLGLAHSHSVGRTLSGQTHTAPACNRPKATPALSVVRPCTAISLIGATHSLLLPHMHTTPLSPRAAH
jgi:hypothetical protein